MSEPDNIPLGQSNKRNIISNIEYTLDTTNRLNLTSDLIKGMVTRITDVHIWLRSHEADTQTFKAGKSAVLTYIRNAETKLTVAVTEYTRHGHPTEKFLNSVNAGIGELEKALNAW